MPKDTHIFVRISRSRDSETEINMPHSVKERDSKSNMCNEQAIRETEMITRAKEVIR